MSRSLSQVRARTTRAIAGMALPECWASGAATREALLLAKPVSRRTIADRRDLKREARKALALETRG